MSTRNSQSLFFNIYSLILYELMGCRSFNLQAVYFKSSSMKIKHSLSNTLAHMPHLVFLFPTGSDSVRTRRQVTAYPHNPLSGGGPHWGPECCKGLAAVQRLEPGSTQSYHRVQPCDSADSL